MLEIQGFSRCLHHTSLISLARQGGPKWTTVVWLDQVNAYDSMLHELIEVAMNTYHVPLQEKKIVGDYYYGIEIGYTFGKFTAGGQQLEMGIATSCTNPQIFVMGISLMATAIERKTRGPKKKSETYQLPIKGFMDDLAVTTTKDVQTRWVFSLPEGIVTLACMKFKAK